MRLMGRGGGFDQARVQSQLAQDGEFPGIGEPGKVGGLQRGQIGSSSAARPGISALAVRKIEAPRAWPYWT